MSKVKKSAKTTKAAPVAKSAATSKTPRGRGRPSKVATTATAAAPAVKKRGRPATTSTTAKAKTTTPKKTLKATATLKGKTTKSAKPAKAIKAPKKSAKPAKAAKSTKRAAPTLAMETSFLNTLKAAQKTAQKQEQIQAKAVAALEKKVQQIESKSNPLQNKLTQANAKVETLPTPAAKNQLKHAQKALQAHSNTLDTLSSDLTSARQLLAAARQTVAKYARLETLLTSFAAEWQADNTHTQDNTSKPRGRKTKQKGFEASPLETLIMFENMPEETNTVELADF